MKRWLALALLCGGCATATVQDYPRSITEYSEDPNNRIAIVVTSQDAIPVNCHMSMVGSGGAANTAMSYQTWTPFVSVMPFDFDSILLAYRKLSPQEQAATKQHYASVAPVITFNAQSQSRDATWLKVEAYYGGRLCASDETTTPGGAANVVFTLPIAEKLDE